MKAFLEIVKLNNDVVTASTGTEPEECCDWGCYDDLDQKAGNY